MRKEIIKPEGEELLRYLNGGYAICNECGAVMDLVNGPIGDIYACPNCGWEADFMDYEYDYGEEREWTPEMLKIFGEENTIPKGCIACGGPYPKCRLGCKLFK